MIKVKVSGSFDNTFKFFERMQQKRFYNVLEKYGRLGVEQLSAYTPKDTGKTAASWSYNIEINEKSATISWSNSNLTKWDTPIVLLLQYGHATRDGAFIQGRDFINPAIQPILDDIANSVWMEVVNS